MPDEDEEYQECPSCQGRGWTYNPRDGSPDVCESCGGRGDNDPDPQCVCGVYASEHRMMGCGNFQTKGQWKTERDFICSLDDDQYEAIYGD